MTRHYFLATALTVLLGGVGPAVGHAADSAEPLRTKKELKAAMANAKTAQDHRRIATYYEAEANRLSAEAKEHDELATTYAKTGNAHAIKHPMSGQTAEHCKHFADAARKAAQASQELAKLHEEMAQQAK